VLVRPLSGDIVVKLKNELTTKSRGALVEADMWQSNTL
jgi:hypothetical protein